ncbi:hypothetical protein [Neptunicella sp. SCSIO 80796]|uniref:hypothetical protein n=1 Tax=Neptunicella plasticusilytica TaxID=3117012 RepID=UPI003A4E23BB
MKKILIVVGILICVALHIAGWWFLYPHATGIEDSITRFTAPQIVQDNWPAYASMFPGFILGLSTLLGILSSIIWARSQDPSSRLTLASFAPIVLSPLVLFVTYSVAIEHPDAFAGSLMAFQNGFFWQTMLGVNLTRKGTQKAGTG